MKYYLLFLGMFEISSCKNHENKSFTETGDNVTEVRADSSFEYFLSYFKDEPTTVPNYLVEKFIDLKEYYRTEDRTYETISFDTSNSNCKVLYLRAIQVKSGKAYDFLATLNQDLVQIDFVDFNSDCSTCPKGTLLSAANYFRGKDEFNVYYIKSDGTAAMPAFTDENIVKKESWQITLQGKFVKLN